MAVSVARPPTAADGQTFTTAQRPFIVPNALPSLPSAKFKNRELAMLRLRTALTDEKTRLLVLEGRNGIGKTTLLRELCDQQARADLAIPLDALIYFSARGARWITVSTLLAGLTEAVIDPTARRELRERANTRRWRTVAEDVLVGLGYRRVVVVVDEADALFDDRGKWRDKELYELVVLLAERSAPHVVLVLPMTGQHRRCIEGDPRFKHCRSNVDLDKGLPTKEAVTLLRELINDYGTAASASSGALAHLCGLTGGHPGALELLVGLMRITGQAVDALPGQLGTTPVTSEKILSLIFDAIPLDGKRVMQAFAVFARPVPIDAVAHLLGEVAPNLNVAAVVEQLARLYVVHRHDANLWYLPNSEVVLATLPGGDETRITSLPAREYLLLRGAAYFRSQRNEHPVRVDDLWPHFGEIELTLRAHRHEEALDLMDDVDEEYLTQWGHSHLLIPWREEIRSRSGVPNLAGRNISMLAAARRQQRGSTQDVEDIREALLRAEIIGNPEIEVAMILQLAQTLLETERTTEAAGHFETARIKSSQFSLVESAVMANLGLAVSLAKTGSFQIAEERMADARPLLAHLNATAEGERLAVMLLANQSWLADQRGRYPEAERYLGEGTERARAAGGSLLYGRFLNRWAWHSLVNEDPEGSMLWAADAASIGEQLDNHWLLREANTIRSLAALAAGRLDDADRLIGAATNYIHTPAALGLLGVLGVVRFRLGDLPTARALFNEALTLCQSPAGDRMYDKRDYQMADARGVVLCGLALLDQERYPTEHAVEAFRHARGIATEPGIVAYIDLLLRQFGDYPEILDRVRGAARGE